MYRPLLMALLVPLSSCHVSFSGMNHRTEGSFAPPSDMDGIHTLRLSGTNGSIQVEARDQQLCSGSIEYSVRAKTLETLEERKAEIEVTETRQDGVLELSLRGDPDSVSFRLVVPENLSLALDTSNDDIILEGAFRDVVADTSNDDILLRGTVHSFKLNTSNDDITIILAHGLGADSRAVTSNGNIELLCTDLLNAKVKVRTSNGNTDVSEASSEPEHHVDLVTSNGDIRVREQTGGSNR